MTTAGFELAYRVNWEQYARLISKDFQSGKAAGYDKVPITVVKRSMDIISKPLAHIINLFILQGTVPDQTKIVRVIPLSKANDRAMFTNY